MIQRIQTVYLFIIVGLLTAMFFTNLAEVTCKAGEFTNVAPDGSIIRLRSFEESTISVSLLGIEYSQVEDKQYTWTSAILLLISTVLPFITIFAYHHRQFQLKMCFVEGVLLLGLIGFEILYFKAVYDYINSAGFEHAIVYGIPTVFPLISLILLFLAGRGIIKDEALVASYDRLR